MKHPFQTFSMRGIGRTLLPLAALLAFVPASADQGADLAIRLLQGVLGAAQQSSGAVGPSRAPNSQITQFRSPPAYQSKEEWMQALRADPVTPSTAVHRDYKRLFSSVWLILNTPEPIVGWPRDNVDWVSFEERIIRNLRNTDQELARVLTDRPPSFMVSSAPELQRTVNMASAELGNPASMSGCRVSGQSCSQKVLAFYQEYISASMDGIENTRQARVAEWKQQEAMRQQAQQQRQAAFDAAEQERQQAEAARIRAETERVRAEEERRARQRAARVGG